MKPTMKTEPAPTTQGLPDIQTESGTDHRQIKHYQFFSIEFNTWQYFYTKHLNVHISDSQEK